MKKLILYGICIIILLSLVSASGNIQTNTINPATIELCGSHSQYTTITASNILNKANQTLASVSATLQFNSDPGLSFITPQTVNIGDIAASSYSSINPSWTIQCNSPNQGIYTAYVTYQSANGYSGTSVDEAYSLITVHDLNSFTGNASISQEETDQTQPVVISDSTPTIQVTTSRESICKGTLDLDETYDNMDFVFYGTEKYHNYTFLTPVSEGEHTVYVKCKDEFDNIMLDSILILFDIDTAEPVITILSPENVVVQEYTELKISVNEDADCRFEDDERSFDNMDEFDVVNGNIFSIQLDDLDEETYTYYVKCRDEVGNIVSHVINFEVEIPPKAKIILEKEPPLSVGTFEITLIPSKELRSVPELSYEWETETDEIYKREVNLVKSGSHYKGFIIIKDEPITRSGKFDFKGYDLKGNEGTEITQGAAFLVDTIEPPAPVELALSTSSDGIVLEWYYDGEKVDHFNIYRSTSSNPSPIDFYDEAKGDDYLDDNLLKNQLYYYKMAAVDIAGNIGPMSKEVSIYSESGKTGSTQTVVQNENPPTDETRDWKDQLEKDIETILIDLEWAEKNMQDLATKEKIVEELGLEKQVLDSKKDIEKLQTQIKALNELRITDTEMREALSSGDSLIARTRKIVPQDLEVTKSTSVVQSLSDSDIELAVEEYANYANSNYSDSKIKSYIKQMEKINNEFEVSVDIDTINIEYLDNSEETLVYVEKGYKYNDPEKLSNVIIIELIPKTVAGDLSDVDIRTPDYDVINEDPVVSWSFDELGFEKKTIKYVVFSDDVSESAKAAKTILLQDPMIVLGEQKNMLTGFSVFVSGIDGIEIIGLIVGVIVILGLAMYYMVVINEVDISRFIPKISLKNNPEKKVQKIDTKVKTQSKNREKRNENVSLERDTSEFDYIFRSENPLKTIPQQYFHTKNGDVIRSVTELKDVISQMDDFTFYYHVNSENHDFADWVQKVYHNKKLSSYIRKQKTKEDLIKLLDNLNK